MSQFFARFVRAEDGEKAIRLEFRNQTHLLQVGCLYVGGPALCSQTLVAGYSGRQCPRRWMVAVCMAIIFVEMF